IASRSFALPLQRAEASSDGRERHAERAGLDAKPCGSQSTGTESEASEVATLGVNMNLPAPTAEHARVMAKIADGTATADDHGARMAFHRERVSRYTRQLAGEPEPKSDNGPDARVLLEQLVADRADLRAEMAKFNARAAEMDAKTDRLIATMKEPRVRTG